MLRRILVWLFHCLLITVPFAFTAINDELFEFNKMMLVYAITIAILGVWVARMVTERRVIWRSTALGWLVLLYWVSYALTTLFSIHLPTSLFGYYSRFHGGLLSITTYSVLYFAAISNLRRRDAMPLIITQVLAATAVALYAVPEHFNWSPSCSLIQGSLEPFTTSCWSEENNPFYRVFGTFGQPNWLAAYLVTSLPLAFWVWLSPLKTDQPNWYKTWQLHWPLVSIVLMTLAIIYSKSRSGVLALILSIAWIAVAMLIPTVRQYRTDRSEKLWPWAHTAVATCLGTLLITGVLGVFGTPWHTAPIAQLWSSHETEQSTELTELPSTGTVLETGGTESGEIRKIVWQGAFQVWKRYPVFGSGPETFAYSYYKDRPLAHNGVSEWDFLYNKAHNEFLNTLSTRGLVGFITELALMIGFVGVIVWKLFQMHFMNKKMTLSSRSTTLLGIVLLGGYGALAVTNFFGFSTVMVGILFFLFPAWWELSQQTDDETVPIKNATRAKKQKNARLTPANTEPWNEPQPIWVLYALITATVLYGWLMLYSSWYNDILLADAKTALAANNGPGAYQTIVLLTERAPNEAVFWEQRGLTMARLAAATAAEDASTAAVLAQDAVVSADTALRLNPVHLNMHKSKARVYLSLSVLDQAFLNQAVEVLVQAQELAPTDAKLPYNLALIHTSLENTDQADEYFTRTLELKPNYEEARNIYAQFLAGHDRLDEAAEQYRYILEHLNPNAPTAQNGLAAIEASQSASQ